MQRLVNYEAIRMLPKERKGSQFYWKKMLSSLADILWILLHKCNGIAIEKLARVMKESGLDATEKKLQRYAAWQLKN